MEGSDCWGIEFQDEEDNDDELNGSLLDCPDKNFGEPNKLVENINENYNKLFDPNRHDRCIVHVDIDCFYAQVEMNKNPSLRDKPIGVQQKNLVVTTNYAARKLGVPKSCWTQEARKVCPTIVLINGEDLHDYRQVSQRISELLKIFGVPVERLGMDENYLDVTSLVSNYLERDPSLVGQECYDDEPGLECECGCYSRLKIASNIASDIRAKVYEELSITSSAGIAHNKLLAKMVGSRHKPNNQTTLYPGHVKRFMLEIHDVSKIPGIGSVMCKKLSDNNIKTVLDLQLAGVQNLSRYLDEQTAKRVWELSVGVDRACVKQSVPSKSIGLEDRFKGLYTKKECVQKLKWLLGRLSILIHEDGRLPSVIKVTARDYFKDKFVKKFHKESRQCKINANLFETLMSTRELNSDACSKIETVMIQLLEKMVDTKKEFHLTLLGLSVSGFVSQKNTKGKISSFFKDTLCIASSSGKESESIHTIHSSHKNSGETTMETSPKKEIETNQHPLTCLAGSVGAMSNSLLNARKRTHNEEEQANEFETQKKPRLNEEVNNNVIVARTDNRLDNNAKLLTSDVDPTVFAQLPADIQKEILGTDAKAVFPDAASQLYQPNPLKTYKSSALPPGWDKDVFDQLPSSIRQELLIRQDLETTNVSTKERSSKTSTNSKGKSKTTTKNIRNYFQKK